MVGIEKQESGQAPEQTADPFDLLYSRWAKQAQRERLAPPSRQRWDAIVLRLLVSEDPERIRRYHRIDVAGPDSLGADAYELWRKSPAYTPNLSVPASEFAEHEKTQRGAMRRLMEAQGLLDKYNAIIEEHGPRQLTDEEKARARRGQQQVMIIGCGGLLFLAFMVLTVLLIMAIRLL